MSRIMLDCNIYRMLIAFTFILGLMVTGCKGANIFFVSFRPNNDPGDGEIYLKNKSNSEILKGRVDFVGMQIYFLERGYNHKPFFTGEKVMNWLKSSLYIVFSPEDEKKIRLLFMKNLNIKIQKKIYKYEGNTSFKKGDTAYQQIQRTFNHYYIPIYDELRREDSSDDRLGRMDNQCLSFLKKGSNADYFFVIAIRPLEVHFENQTTSMKIALLTVLYNREGEKVYSKIYEETLDGIKDPEKEKPYYECSRNLINHYGEQINKDLSFLLTADDAKTPTIEDLYKELNRH